MLFPMSLKIATGKNLEFECSIYIHVVKYPEKSLSQGALLQ